MAKSGKDAGTGGFAMIDALVAVGIISMLIGVSIGSLRVVQVYTQTTHELKDARVLLTALMATTPKVPGTYQGQNGGMKYDVLVVADTASDVQICRVTASVVGAKGRHIYKITGTRWCAERVI